MSPLKNCLQMLGMGGGRERENRQREEEETERGGEAKERKRYINVSP